VLIVVLIEHVITGVLVCVRKKEDLPFYSLRIGPYKGDLLST
jgi:hypothetical protein